MRIENRTGALIPEKSWHLCFNHGTGLLSNLVQIPLSACCESEFRFHYHLSSLFPALKSHSKWIELGCNSFFCSFRWISSDSCIPKSSMINMMMSWPSLALFWPRAYWTQVNVFKSSRFIYFFKFNEIFVLTIWQSRNWVWDKLFPEKIWNLQFIEII